MERSYRKLNQARLSVLTLESRVTPGSLVMSDVAGLGDVLSRPESHDSGATTIKKIQDDQIQIVAPAQLQGAENIASAATAARPSTGIVQQGMSDLGQSQQVNAPKAIVTPQPQKAATRAQAGSAKVTANSPVDRSQGDVRPDRLQAPAKSHALTAAPRAVEGLKRVEAPTPKFVACEPGGTKDFGAAQYNIVVNGTGGTDVINDVFAGKAGNTGTSYAVGSRTDGVGTDAYVQALVGSAPTCGGIVEIEDPAGATFTGVTVTVEGVYVSGHLNDKSVAFGFRFDAALTTVVDSFGIAPTDPLGTVELNGVGFSPNGSDLDIAFAGGSLDPAGFGLPYELGVTIVVDPGDGFGAPELFTAFDFGFDSQLDGVAMDRPGNSYWGGRTEDPGIGDAPLTFRLDNDYATIPWAFFWDFDGTFELNKNVGVRGVRFLGGLSDAGGVYFLGTQHYQATLDPSIVPGSVHQLGLKLNELDGSFDISEPGYAFIFYSGGFGDLGGTDLAVDRNGNAYHAAYRSESDDVTDHAGRVYRFSLLEVTDYQLNYSSDDDGLDQRINGVDLVTTAPTADLLYGGETGGQTVTPPLTANACNGDAIGVGVGSQGFIGRNPNSGP